MKNRTELAQFFADSGFKKGAEIGVYRGYYSKLLLDTIPGLNLLSIDPWHRQKIHIHVYHESVELLADYPNSTILRGFSADIVKYITNESLDFVYIDGDHRYDFVREDITEWSKKVRKGGIVAGHDYFKARESEVVRAVDDYVKENNLELFVTDWDEETTHGDDKQPSWYFRKE